MTSVLVATGLSKRYGAAQALDNVGFELRAGEVHGLCGENGAGVPHLSVLDDVMMGAAEVGAIYRRDKFKAAVRKPGMSGDIIMITGILGQSQSIDRSRGFKEELAKIAPWIKVVGEQPGNWDQGVSTDAAAGLFTKYGPSVKGVYAHEDAMMVGAIVAAERAGLDPTRLATVAVGCEPIGVTLMKNGQMYGAVKQSPIDEARYAIDSVVAYLDGKKLEKTRYVPIPNVTKDNVDKECEAWSAK